MPGLLLGAFLPILHSWVVCAFYGRVCGRVAWVRTVRWEGWRRVATFRCGSGVRMEVGIGVYGFAPMSDMCVNYANACSDARSRDVFRIFFIVLLFYSLFG